MNVIVELKAGFARVDITPSLGTELAKSYYIQHAIGVLDPLLASAVAFDDGQNKAVILSLDLCGIDQELTKQLRSRISEATGLDPLAIFIACTHTHQGPKISGKYVEFLAQRLCDVIVMAINDVVPAKMFYTFGCVEDVAFVRRYRMKDGSVKTNPGPLNPDVVCRPGDPDESSSLLIIKREGKPEIGLVNFQVHPDVIGGKLISADYPKYVRDTYEMLIPNSRCVYINGAQGDTNHFDIRRPKDQLYTGIERSIYMGRKIAMSVAANYPLANELPAGEIRFGQHSVPAKYNKGTPEQLEEAEKIVKDYIENGINDRLSYSTVQRRSSMPIPMARRITDLSELPDEQELNATAVAIGDFVIAGFPGEPFTDLGREVKQKSKFKLTFTACCANGYEGYYPVKSAYDGGYETVSARFAVGTAEQLTETLAELVNSL